LKVTLSEFQYCTITGKGVCIFTTIPDILNIFDLKISSPAFISCKDLIKQMADKSGQSVFQNIIGD